MRIIARDQVREPLYAIVPLSNPWRWKSRWKHTERAIKHFIDSGCVVVLVEVGFNRRELVFADSGLDGTPANCGILGTDQRFRHKYIGLHSSSELWLKENQICLGVQSLPYDWQQVAWLDSDVHFIRPNWCGEAIHKLQHYSFLQLFSQARDLGPNYEMLPEDHPHANGLGFVEAWKRGFIQSSPNPIIEADVRTVRKDINKFERDFAKGRLGAADQDTAKLTKDASKLEGDFDVEYPPYTAKRVFPGLAWACTRQAWEAVGGLIDFAVWGGSDHHSAHALIEKTEGMMRGDLHRNYQKMVMQWYHRCRTHIRQNVGVMSGSIFHSWHGSKTQRHYNTKHGLLAKIGFDPLRHLKRDSAGLYQLHDDRSSAYVKLRDVMRRIATERDEDSTHTGLEDFDQSH